MPKHMRSDPVPFFFYPASSTLAPEVIHLGPGDGYLLPGAPRKTVGVLPTQAGVPSPTVHYRVISMIGHPTRLVAFEMPSA